MHLTTSKPIIFQVVSDEHRQTAGEVRLPVRASSGSMAYDFFSNESFTLMPHQAKMVWTDVKAIMPSCVGLVINVRSSMGMKGIRLMNTSGWIDSDYANNPKNDGNIGICLENDSSFPYVVSMGDRIAQGMFVPFLVTHDDNQCTSRSGGFGSTGV